LLCKGEEHDKENTWQRQLAARHKERGDPGRDVWQEIQGDIDTFHIVTFGGDTNRWVSGARIPNFAALNGPGPRDMVWGSEVRVLRYRADLSHA